MSPSGWLTKAIKAIDKDQGLTMGIKEVNRNQILLHFPQPRNGYTEREELTAVEKNDVA